MHNGSLRKWSLALTFWLALHASALKAQIFSNDLPLQAVTTGTNPVDFEFRADGTMIAFGNLGIGSLTSADEGAGTRMLWFPSLAAFRAGSVNGNNWDPDNLGEYSAALGWNTIASGQYSMAFGKNSIARGVAAVAMGAYNTASGYYSFATGYSSQATDFSTVAMGVYSTASAGGATALGSHSTAAGPSSTAMGSSTAIGNGATSMGNHTTASGYASTASGYWALASADYSSSSGLFTTASAYNSFVVGTNNVGGGDPNHWVATDPLFEVGNGSGSGYGNPSATGPSDALVVYKNGNAVLQGSLQVTPSGDIPMYVGE